MMDGTIVNVDVTAPGAIIALALMFLKVKDAIAGVMYEIFALMHCFSSHTYRSSDIFLCWQFFHCQHCTLNRLNQKPLCLGLLLRIHILIYNM